MPKFTPEMIAEAKDCFADYENRIELAWQAATEPLYWKFDLTEDEIEELMNHEDVR